MRTSMKRSSQFAYWYPILLSKSMTERACQKIILRITLAPLLQRVTGEREKNKYELGETTVEY